MNDTRPNPTAALNICRRCGSWDNYHDPVPGDCQLPHRRHSRHLIDGTQTCHPCITRHRDWLTEIHDLYTELPHIIDPGSVDTGDVAEHWPTKKAVEPAPIRLDAWSLIFDEHRLYATGRDSDLPAIPTVLSSWALNALEDQHLTGNSVDGSLATACKLLDVHAERIAAMDWISDYDLELGWCRRALRRAHGISGNPPPLGPCITVTDTGSCPGSVWKDPDGGKPRCDRCRRRYGTLDCVRMKADARRP